jgi:hypothetical protein
MAKIMATRHKESWPTSKGMAHARHHSWPVPDKGHPGKYRGKKWFDMEEGDLHGWHADESAEARRKALDVSVRADTYPTTVRRLNALKNVSTVRKVDQAATKDMEYLRRKYRGD